MLSLPVATATATTAAATFLARTFRRPIAGLALFHGGQCRILARRPLLRLLLTILRLALALFLAAVASLIATVFCILTRAPARLIALVAIAAPVGTAVPVIAARRRIAIALRIARPRFHRFGYGFRLAREPAEYFLQDGGFWFFAWRHDGRWLGRRNSLHGGLRSLRLRLLNGGGRRYSFRRDIGHLVAGHSDVILIEFVVLQPCHGVIGRFQAYVRNQEHVDLQPGFDRMEFVAFLVE